MNAEPLGVYVHLPFCAGKCPYCDFNSRPARPGEPIAYIRALEREAELRLTDGAAADTMYFGGGTPTVLPPAALGRLLRALEARLALAADAEITVEANPESATADTLAELRQAGFNRLSIGAQAFDDEVLAALGRRHDAARAADAVRHARAVGWDDISVDLIFGVPGQSSRQWAATLERTVGLRPEHISTYCLTIEPGTEFHRQYMAGELTSVGEELELEMYSAARTMLSAAGYEHYEISNFALPGRRCRHNEKYWCAGDYVGLGAGAHSGVSGVRWANAADPQDYIAALDRGRFPVVYAERLSARRKMDEALILGLRTARGACLTQVGVQSGRDAAREYRTEIRQLVSAGLATTDGSRVVLTERGMALANEVAIRVMA